MDLSIVLCFHWTFFADFPRGIDPTKSKQKSYNVTGKKELNDGPNIGQMSARSSPLPFSIYLIPANTIHKWAVVQLLF